MEPLNTATDEAFLLDLLNSTPIVDGVPRDDLDTARAGRTWLRAHGHSGSADEWQAVRAARSALQKVVRGQEPARSLAAFSTTSAIAHRYQTTVCNGGWTPPPTGRLRRGRCSRGTRCAGTARAAYAPARTPSVRCS